jgi:hypothetical protein
MEYTVGEGVDNHSVPYTRSNLTYPPTRTEVLGATSR